jgi:hypothetical protein
MVVKRRLLLAITAALTLAMTAAAPALGGYRSANPDPLAQQELLRVQDIAATGKTQRSGPIVAVGWRQASQPGELFVTYSTDGGSSYLKKDGSQRSFRVAGDGTRGLSLDSCAGIIWVASAANYPGDAATDRDLLLTSRTVTGSPGQAFLTNASASRAVRSASVACVGKKLLAIAWLEQSFGKPRAKLMLRSLEPAGEATSFRKVYGLGEANLKGGIAVDASTDSVHVAWTVGDKKDLRYQRFLVAEGKQPAISRQSSVRLAAKDVQFPQVATRGQKVVIAYSDAGKVKTRISGDSGARFDKPAVVVGTGSRKSPSRVHSADVSGPRIVLEVSASQGGLVTPQRIQSTDSGATWQSSSFGHVGARVGALRKTSPTSSLLAEAWQNNAPGPDTLRAQVEQ